MITDIFIINIVLGLTVLILLWDRFRVSWVMFSAVAVLLLSGVIVPTDILSGFSNKSIITIFLLIFTAGVLSQTFKLESALDKIFGTARTVKSFLFRMSTSVGLVSAIMNNTPIVALMIPYVYRWSKDKKVSPSKLFIPLSYSAIIGGMITPIGTSTNLVLIGFIASTTHPNLSFGDFIIPGIVALVAGIVFITLFSGFLLPSKMDVLDEFKTNIREYLAETVITKDSPLIGKTINEASLRNLDGVFLVEILRSSGLVKPAEPHEILQEGDRLYFAGETDYVVKLVEDREGLDWVRKDKFEIDDQLEMIEVVVPANSNLEGKTLKNISFREKYDAAVVGIHRNSSRLRGKLGEIPIAAGDLLLLMTGSRFELLSQRDTNFYTVSIIKESMGATRQSRGLMGITIACLIAAIAGGLLSLFSGLLILLAVSAFLRLFSDEDAKKNFSIDLFIVLGSAITLGIAFIETGAAEQLATPLISFLEGLPIPLLLFGVFALAFIFTSFITNAAAISILFPIVYQLIQDLHLEPVPIYLTLAFGASCAFLTPVGYQTNLMVMGPGSYKTHDFLKIGIPFTFVYGFVVIGTILLLYYS